MPISQINNYQAAEERHLRSIYQNPHEEKDEENCKDFYRKPPVTAYAVKILE